MTLECNPPMKTLGLSAEDADKGAATHVPRVKSGCCWPRNSGGSRPSSVSRRMSSWTTCADISLHRTRPVSGGLPCHLRALPIVLAKVALSWRRWLAVYPCIALIAGVLRRDAR